MSERIKSLSEKKIEKSLGITDKSADDLSDLDENVQNNINEDEQAKIEYKQEQAKLIQKKIEDLKSLKDKDFSKEMFKQIAIEGFELFQTTKGEMEIDPSPRYVEVMATLGNAIVTATANYQGIETTDEKFKIEREKLTIKDKNPTTNVTNIAFSGSIQEALRQLKSLNAPKTIDVKAEVKKED